MSPAIKQHLIDALSCSNIELSHCLEKQSGSVSRTMIKLRIEANENAIKLAKENA